MKILTYGNDTRVSSCAAMLSRAELRAPSLMLLPIPVTKDKKHINGTDIELESLLSEMESGMIVAGYDIPRLLRRGSASEFCDVMSDERFLADNARLTAIGALGYILGTATRAPSDISFAVVGYGRIGRELVRLLLFFGAAVTVYTSKEKTRLALGELGIRSRLAAYGTGAGELSDIDILINTAPAPLLCDADVDKDRVPRLIELASGNNFPRGAKVERLMSLPGQMYPESAAVAYFASIMRMVGGTV